MAKEESVTLTGHVTATPFKVNIIGWNALLVYFRFWCSFDLDLTGYVES